ncbi:hypothetical protein [Streptomyces sp. NPDC002547]
MEERADLAGQGACETGTVLQESRSRIEAAHIQGVVAGVADEPGGDVLRVRFGRVQVARRCALFADQVVGGCEARVERLCRRTADVTRSGRSTKSLTAIDLMVTVAKASDGAGRGGTTSSNIDNTRLAADGIRVLLMHHGEFIALCTS